VLNERVFENDGEAVKVPLKLCVSASNEWPSPDSGKELSALLDRFLFRKSVARSRRRSGRQRLLWHRDHTPKLSATITPRGGRTGTQGGDRGAVVEAAQERIGDDPAGTVA